jgi:hypothetical protein
MAAAKKVAILAVEPRTTWTKDGREMNLKDPEGNPSDAQLAVLNKRGCLAIVSPGQVEKITKGLASAALDATQA